MVFPIREVFCISLGLIFPRPTNSFIHQGQAERCEFAANFLTTSLLKHIFQRIPSYSANYPIFSLVFWHIIQHTQTPKTKLGYGKKIVNMLAVENYFIKVWVLFHVFQLDNHYPWHMHLEIRCWTQIFITFLQSLICKFSTYCFNADKKNWESFFHSVFFYIFSFLLFPSRKSGIWLFCAGAPKEP